MVKRAKRVKSVGSERLTISDRSLSKKKHDELLTWLFDRIMPAYCEHTDRVYLYDCVTEGLAAKYENKGFEKEREIAYAKGQTSIQSDIKYPKVLGNVNDIAANVINILFPARQMYGSVETSPTKQDITAAFVSEMNKNSRKFKHFTNMTKCITDAIAYNVAIVENDYLEVKGYTGSKTRERSNLSATNNTQIIKRGTRLKHLDIYNTILDWSADIENYSTDAEFYVKVERVTDNDLLRKQEQGEILLANDILNLLRRPKVNGGKIETSSKGSPFYNTGHFSTTVLGNRGGSSFAGMYHYRCDFRSRYNHIREHYSHEDNNKPFDHIKSIYGSDGERIKEKQTALNELVTITIRASEEDIGLSSKQGTARDQSDGKNIRKIWRIGIVNGIRIVSIDEIATNHGMLPCSVTVPKTELSDTCSLSLSEQLLPFQEADSSLMNIFIKQARSDKNKGLTFYAKEIVDLDEWADPTTGRIGVNLKNKSGPDGKNYRLQDLVHNVQGHPINRSLIEGMGLLEQKSQDIFPTQSVDQLANLNRPVTHQSRSLTQLQNLPVFIFARTIHDELLEPQNYMHVMDIINNNDTISMMNSEGNEEQVDPTTLDLESVDLAVSDGLRGIDTIAVMDRLNQILQYAFQSPEVLREYDVMLIADYLLKMEGANIEMEAFKFQNPFDALPPEQKELAVQLLQQAAAEQGNDDGGGEL